MYWWRIKKNKIGKKWYTVNNINWGSTRIPKVQVIVGNYFPELKEKNKINKEINADEAVAVGATIAAEKIINNKDKSISYFVMLDVIPLSLRTNVKNNYKDEKVRDEGEIMDVIIKRGTYFPVNAKKTYYTVSDIKQIWQLIFTKEKINC